MPMSTIFYQRNPAVDDLRSNVACRQAAVFHQDPGWLHGGRNGRANGCPRGSSALWAIEVMDVLSQGVAKKRSRRDIACKRVFTQGEKAEVQFAPQAFGQWGSGYSREAMLYNQAIHQALTRGLDIR